VLTGTEGTTGVTGGSVAVGAGVGLGAASVGAGVRGATVGAAEGDELGDDDADADGEGLADGDATCCAVITAAPRRSNATSATAANTVNTVDQRSTSGPPDGAPAARLAAARRSRHRAVAPAGRSHLDQVAAFPACGIRPHEPCRTVGRSKGRLLGLMRDVRELVSEDSENDDQDDREEHHAHEIIDKIPVSLHDG